MDRTAIREWLQIVAIPFQTLGIVFIPIMVTIMGNAVVKSNSTRETNAVYVQTAVGLLSAPITVANRGLRPWARQVLAHSSPVPFSDTAEASLVKYPLVLGRPLPLEPRRLFVFPKRVTLTPTAGRQFFAVGLTAAGDTAPLPYLKWSANGGSITEMDNDGGRYYASFEAGTTPGDFVVIAGTGIFADTAHVHIQPR